MTVLANAHMPVGGRLHISARLFVLLQSKGGKLYEKHHIEQCRYRKQNTGRPGPKDQAVELWEYLSKHGGWILICSLHVTHCVYQHQYASS